MRVARAFSHQSGFGDPSSLLPPRKRRVHRQVEQRQRVWQGLVQDRGLNVRSQCGQVDNPADVASVDVFQFGNRREVGDLAALDKMQPPVTDTNDTPWRSNTSTLLEKSARLACRTARMSAARP